MSDDLDRGTWVNRVEGRAKHLHVRKCRVQILSGPDAGAVRELALQRIQIGAAAANDVVLSDRSVSGVHCEIAVDESGYRLRDLGSRNGTFVRGHRAFDIGITGGTVVEIGTSSFQFWPLSDSVEVPLWSADRFGRLVGRSVVMRELFARLSRIAGTDATVVITGETGSGKDLVAEAVHEASPRASGPFVVLDCGAIPPNLIESEIFGHEKGAFTGATAAFAGAFERADGGTLFLDEIGELSVELQPKLLRVLERNELRRVGGSASIRVDVRVVAATNRDLGQEVNRGNFREDLYYRLAVANVHVPPLRQRQEDIELLVEHFLSVLPGHPTMPAETLALMMRHDWPGNVRELRNVVVRAGLLDEQPTTISTLRRHSPRAAGRTEPVVGAAGLTAAAPAEPVEIMLPFAEAKQRAIDEFERRYVQALLEAHEFNISAAARAAGTNRMTIHKIAERLGLRRRS